MTPHGEPAWVTEARLQIGQREIPGPRHNRRIIAWFKGWFSNDETPWCGAFVEHCLNVAGIKGPKIFVRAKEWATWGVACPPTLGVIGVKSRKGGGHVFIIIGETPDRKHFKVIHGNADNMVCAGDIAKADVIATRWPAGVPLVRHGLPIQLPGKRGATEA